MKKDTSEKDIFDDDFEIIYESYDTSGQRNRRQTPGKSPLDGGSNESWQDSSEEPVPIRPERRPSSEQRRPASNDPAASNRKPVKNNPSVKQQPSQSPSAKRRPALTGNSGRSKTSAPERSSASARQPVSSKTSYAAKSASDEPRKKKKRKKAPNLISPAMNTAKAGGKAVFKIAGMILRYGSVILIGYIIYLTASKLWSGHAAYGDFYLLIKQKNYSLGAYTAASCVLLLYEFISLFWSFSGPKTREGRKVEKIDTGRGFLFFILIFAGSFLAANFTSLIPSSPAFLQGISGSLSIYGTLKPTLLPLCLFGAVLCIIRKFITK